jgi:ribose-phosphate pyrophosphokinase
MELLVIIDAFRRASVMEINVVIPYFGYARQDKKVKPREPISAALVAKLIEAAGASHVTVCDIHAEQIQGFFDIPVDNLYAGPIIQRFYENEGYAGQSDICVVSPDVSGVGRAKNLAEPLGATIAIVAKRRPDANVVDVVEVIGDVKGKRCIMLDDMIDTGGTIIAGAEALIHRGAASVEVATTHLILSANASQRLQDSDAIKRVVGLDTVPIPSAKIFPKLKVLPVAPLIGEAIRRFNSNESVSELFEKWRH